ncbi:hypothetical protein [Acinetobacter sp. ANC 3813]|uniref:hypothetical protein n=1 Tax=Acinetobacter sp. ANC 3813 TaxID=1977873 RepID=UPI000A34022E|nr:hypothetical protein [Acinetobacter sp. ANC 3813]OTG87923.1 hypothetical protein B9T34_16450 [Acinetobacter sp. ANC 3813]
MQIEITATGPYYRQYVAIGDIVEVEGFTVHGHPYITSKHKNNRGHMVVFQVGKNCKAVPAVSD